MAKKITFEDGEVWTEDQLNNRLSDSYELGIITGIERAASNIMKQANVYFSNGKDDLAKLFRAESQVLYLIAKDARESRDKKISERSKNNGN